MSNLFFYPMASLVFFTFFYGISMFLVRVNSVRTGQVDPRYFKLFKEGVPSDLVLKMGQHFVNLFEVPVVFYVACLTFLALQLYSEIGLKLAWIFFASRLVHAYIHTTHNRVIPRMLAFFTGVFSVLGLWICLFLAVRNI